MALAAKATIKHYFPDDQIFPSVEKQVILWLENGVEVPDNFANTVFSDLDKIGKYQAAGVAYSNSYQKAVIPAQAGIHTKTYVPHKYEKCYIRFCMPL